MSFWAGKRLFIYPVLVFFFVISVHSYVTNPALIKRIPYAFDAWLMSSSIQCNGKVDGLSDILSEVSLPLFSLTGKVVYVGANGEVSQCGVSENGEALGADFRFRFASMTKAVTAFAALDLSKSGKLDLNAPVLSFFPEVDAEQLSDNRVAEITVQQLLNHSSGLGGVFGSDDMVKKGHKPWCPYDFSRMERIRLVGEPGTNHLYSNVAYCLIGEVISRAAGVPYRDFIRDNYLTGKSSLRFLGADGLQGEPEYDFFNEYRIKSDYVDWLDFFALSSAAGLAGQPEEFADLVWDWSYRHPGAILDGPRVPRCKEIGEEPCFSYTFSLEKEERKGALFAIQEGYMPGASSLVAISSTGQVIVWVAAGAPQNEESKRVLINKIGDIFKANR